MFGLTEVLDQLSSTSFLYENNTFSIVPTVLLPLAFLSTGISVVATFVAGLFGVELKAEGPKKLLELLLRPKILISALILNGVIFLALSYIEDFRNGPSPFFVQDFMNKDLSTNKVTKVKLAIDSKWSINIQEGVFAKGTIVDQELFVGTKEGNLFVIDIESGEVKAEIYLGSFLSPTPVLFKGYLYFGEGLHKSHSMRIYKFNPKTREIVSSFSTMGHTEIQPVIHTINGRDILYQSAGGDGLYAIDPHTMQLVWHHNDGHMDSFVNVHQGSVYVASGVPEEDMATDRPFGFRLDALTGKVIWKKELPISSWYRPMVLGSDICFSQGELRASAKVGGIICMSKEGDFHESFFIDRPVVNKLVTVESSLIFNDFYGNVYSLKEDSLGLNWKRSNSDIAYNYSSIQTIDSNTMVFVQNNSVLQKIDIRTGSILSEVKLFDKEKVYADPLVIGDDVIVFGYSGTIIRYKM